MKYVWMNLTLQPRIPVLAIHLGMQFNRFTLQGLTIIMMATLLVQLFSFVTNLLSMHVSTDLAMYMCIDVHVQLCTCIPSYVHKE